MEIFAVDMNEENFDIKLAIEALKMEAKGFRPIPNGSLPAHAEAEYIQDGDYQFRHMKALRVGPENGYLPVITHRVDLRCEKITENN